MESTSEYITILSNASNHLFPENTLSDFSVQLQRPLYLDPSKWEVGLTEITLPSNVKEFREPARLTISFRAEKSELTPNLLSLPDTVEPFNNATKHILREETANPRMTPGKGFKPSSDALFRTMSIEIPQDLLEGSFDILLVYINNLFLDESSMPEEIKPILLKRNKEFSGTPIMLSADKKAKIFGIALRDNDVSLALNDTLARSLGLSCGPREWLFFPGPGIYSFRNAIIPEKAIESFFPFLMIYTNIITHSNVSDIRAPLLRTITLPWHNQQEWNGKIDTPLSNQLVHMSFDQVYYFPLALDAIHVINIIIRNAKGEKLPSLPGFIALTLNIRRRLSH